VRLKSKWGELSSVNDDEGTTSNLKLKLKSDFEWEQEEERYKVKFYMADVSISHISKCFKESLMPVEQIWKDNRKIVFIHDAG